MTPKDQLLTEIATRSLGIETLETRHSDSLDFHDVSVAGIRSALEAAFAAGIMLERNGQLNTRLLKTPGL